MGSHNISYCNVEGMDVEEVRVVVREALSKVSDLTLSDIPPDKMADRKGFDSYCGLHVVVNVGDGTYSRTYSEEGYPVEVWSPDEGERARILNVLKESGMDLELTEVGGSVDL